jgi:hypothetical protein
MKRLYKSGSDWCFWRWTFTPSGYITRLHLIKTPLFAVCLHWINGPDPEPHMHDHPVSFLSVILSGWYVEQREDGLHPRVLFNLVRATDRHTIAAVVPGRTALTLAFMGPKVQDWGFWTESGKIPWREYNKKYKVAA